MKQGQAVVLDGFLQQAPSFHPQQFSSATAFPLKDSKERSTKSFSTVIEQALLTQDRPLLKEILTDSPSQSILTTVSELNPSKASSLLLMLQEFINIDSEHVRELSLWVRHLLGVHLGVIVSNLENRDIVVRLRKLIANKVALRARFVQLGSRASGHVSPTTRKEFIPKFVYQESREEEEVEGIQDEDLGSFQDMEEEQF